MMKWHNNKIKQSIFKNAPHSRFSDVHDQESLHNKFVQGDLNNMEKGNEEESSEKHSKSVFYVIITC